MTFHIVDQGDPEAVNAMEIGRQVTEAAWLKALEDPNVSPACELVWKAAFLSGYVSAYIAVSRAAFRLAGTGQEWAGWDRFKGTHFRPCSRCNQTGVAPV